jgi:hypothetical protein
VVTTSGAVLTVVLGVATFAGDNIPIPSPGLAFAAIALVALIAAIVFGLIVNIPVGYAGVAPSELRRLADSETYWTGPFATGSRRVAEVEADAIESASHANGRKATLLQIGIGFEAAAFAALGVAGMIVLFAVR